MECIRKLSAFFYEDTFSRWRIPVQSILWEYLLLCPAGGAISKFLFPVNEERKKKGKNICGGNKRRKPIQEHFQRLDVRHLQV